MQFRDLHRQYERLKPEMDAAIAGVLEDAHYISWPTPQARRLRLIALVPLAQELQCSAPAYCA